MICTGRTRITERNLITCKQIKLCLEFQTVFILFWWVTCGIYWVHPLYNLISKISQVGQESLFNLKSLTLFSRRLYLVFKILLKHFTDIITTWRSFFLTLYWGKRLSDWGYFRFRGTVRVNYLTQEHNTMSPAKAWTWTTCFRGGHTNHEATALPVITLQNVIE